MTQASKVNEKVAPKRVNEKIQIGKIEFPFTLIRNRCGVAVIGGAPFKFPCQVGVQRGYLNLTTRQFVTTCRINTCRLLISALIFFFFFPFLTFVRIDRSTEKFQLKMRAWRTMWKMKIYISDDGAPAARSVLTKSRRRLSPRRFLSAQTESL